MKTTYIPAESRGQTRFDWLEARHSFSFGEYYDPERMGFSPLRVINEDKVAPGGGFPMHPHRDMEIVTIVLSGGLAHRDSLGNGSVIRPGDVQMMRAGSGIRHSEFNDSVDEPVHLLQIWLMPDRQGAAPAYQQRRFSVLDQTAALPRGWQSLVVPMGQADTTEEPPLEILQDARLMAARLGMGQPRLALPALAGGRRFWLQVMAGGLTVEGGDEDSLTLRQGDAMTLEEISAETVTLSLPEGEEAASLLLFDLGR